MTAVARIVSVASVTGLSAAMLIGCGGGSDRERVADPVAAQAKGPQAAGAVFVVNDVTRGDQQQPGVAAAGDGGWLAVYNSAGQDGSLDGIVARRFGADGAPVAPGRVVNQRTVNRQIQPAVAAHPDGGWWVVWQSNDHADDGLAVIMRRVDDTGVPVGVAQRVDTPNLNVAVGVDVAAADDGAALVVWAERRSVGPVLTGVRRFAIRARAYAADGTARGVAMDVRAGVGPTLRRATVAAASGGFAVGWHEESEARGAGIYLRRHDTAGQPLGAAQQIAAGQGLDAPALAAAPDGGWVVLWTAADASLAPAGVFAACVAANGASGPITRLSGGLVGEPVAAAVAQRVLVAARAPDIRAQWLDEACAPVGPHFDMHPPTTLDVELFPAVTALADGGAVVLWQALGGDGDGRAIVGRRLPP